MHRINDCFTCCYYAWDYHLVCAVHPTGLDDESCDDFESDPGTEGIVYRDFLGLGELDADNPWHSNPEENWAPPGTKYVDGELVFIEED